MVEHIVSRFDRSFPPSYRDRVRTLAEMGIVSERFAEKHLVAWVTEYENWAGIRGSVSESELIHFLNEELETLDEFIEAIEEILQDPSRYGFEDPVD